MNKNTVIGFILIGLIFIVGITINTMLYPPTPQAVQTTQNTEFEETKNSQDDGSVVPVGANDVVLVGEVPSVETFSIETEKYVATFSNQGGTIVGYELKDHTDDGNPINMIITNPNGNGAFMVKFGDYTSTQYADDPFFVMRDGNTVTFYQEYGVVQSDGSIDSFTLNKTYHLIDGEYLFQLDVEIVNGSVSAPSLNFGGIAYTLDTGFDIGPPADMDGSRYSDFRKYYAYSNGDRDEVKLKNQLYTSSDHVTWNTVLGKYFALIGITDSTNYTITYNSQDGKNQILYSRPVIKSSSQEDMFRFYLGPKEKSSLAIYDRAEDNITNISGLNLDEAMEKSFWGWLQTIIRVILDFFYNLIPNYGVAIIFTTIVIKLALFPLTKKSYVSMGKMKELQPQLQEIQAKYKDNQQKAQQAQMELYKKEKVSPMGGCLPMLIQFPILIAFYGLLNNYFPLREAVFIPGWIDDLSVPEYLFRISSLEGVFLLGMFEYIRLLPFLYTASMLLSSRLSQASSPGQSAGTMKFMTYGMPLMFFFVLYNVPSGLLLYWMFSNIITVIQQVFIQKYIHNHPEKANKTKKGFFQRLNEKAQAQMKEQQARQRGGKVKGNSNNGSKIKKK